VTGKSEHPIAETQTTGAAAHHEKIEMSTATGHGEKTQASNGRRSAEITMNDASPD
jgi:hypothetical protein